MLESQDPEKTDHDKTVEWILSELKAAGFTDDQIVEQNVDEAGTKIHNIILTVPGEDETKQIIAGAHYDGDGTDDNGTGPEIEDNTLYTNPWTAANPAPSNVLSYSPTTIPASDHVGFMVNGIEYIYFDSRHCYNTVTSLAVLQQCRLFYFLRNVHLIESIKQNLVF